jgi:hypothetical protein
VIRHVVLMRFVDETDAPEAKLRLEALAPLAVSMEVGLDVLRSEASAHLSLITTHDDLAGLKAYAQHPDHEQFLAWVRPRLAARTVVDAEV